MAVPKTPFMRNPYNYDTALAGDEASVKDFGPSLTIQSQAEDADINVVMKRFGITGKMPDDVRPVFYGDFDQVVDYRSAHDALIAADRNFNQLPAEVRSRFGNDPQQFLEFCSNEANWSEMKKMGLAVNGPPQAPLSPPAASESALPPPSAPSPSQGPTG